MASITMTARTETNPHLRPLNIFRDLPAVADLIELCFSNTMDSDGRRYLDDMRRAGKDKPLRKWAQRAAETTSLPLSGYVWEENGRIVGNASLVPFHHRRQRTYLIANVATHPEYRRRGIGRALTERALRHARDKNADEIWLHVRADNTYAIELYDKLGFVERARRNTWQAATDVITVSAPAGVKIGGRSARYWPPQKAWLDQLYPDVLAWQRNWNFNSLTPGLWNWLYLLFIDMNIRQWAAIRGDALEAALAWIPSGRGEALFAAAGPGSDPQVLTSLLLKARRELHANYGSIVMEFPVGRFDDAIQAAGFRSMRTLIWMQAT